MAPSIGLKPTTGRLGGDSSIPMRYEGRYKIFKDSANQQGRASLPPSGGKGNDPMQASECPHNTKYPQKLNGITDPDYSIQVGIHYL